MPDVACCSTNESGGNTMVADQTDRSPPEITAEMRANARANPNTWLYVIDPALDAELDDIFDSRIGD